MMVPRSQQVALIRAGETKIQVISAFGAKHPLARMAEDLEKAIDAESKAMLLAPPAMPEPGPK